MSSLPRALLALFCLCACASSRGTSDPGLSRAFGAAERRLAPPPPRGWELVWSDEFNGPAGAPPDPANWTPVSGGDGWGNHELEYYCAPGSSQAPCDQALPNAALDGQGHLVIAAVRTSSGAWTSARLKTFGKRSFQYGRIEARIRLPAGQGLWPAFWALGEDHDQVHWPDCGEIDVMENVPADVPGGLGADRIKSTIHGPGYSGNHGVVQPVKFPNGGRVDDGFHVYGVIWSPGKISFYVDDPSRLFFTVAPKDLPAGKAWVFDKPFFLLLNLAVGGDWPHDPGPSTPNPARMIVDYVRVYRHP